MKNKFLVMAVVTSMVAALMAPAVFADEAPAVTTTIPAGVLTLDGVNAYASSSVSLTGVAEPPVIDKSATFSSVPASDYFTLTDTTSADGAKVMVKLSSASAGAFVYSGTSDTQLLNPIPAANFKLYPNISGGAYANPTVSLTQAVASDTTDYSFVVDHTNTSADGEVLTNYTFPVASAAVDYSIAMSGVNQNYFVSTTSGPLVGTLRLDRMVLTVPGGSNSGDYASTLVVTATEL